MPSYYIIPLLLIQLNMHMQVCIHFLRGGRWVTEAVMSNRGNDTPLIYDTHNRGFPLRCDVILKCTNGLSPVPQRSWAPLARSLSDSSQHDPTISRQTKTQTWACTENLHSIERVTPRLHETAPQRGERSLSQHHNAGQWGCTFLYCTNSSF